VVTGAALLGIASTYKIFGALIDWFDWPRAFLIAGVVMVLLTWVWAAYATDHPSQHRHANPAERQLVENFRAPENHDAAPVVSRWISVFSNRSLILLTVSYAAVGYFQYLFFYWIHYYFDTVLQLGQSESRTYATLPALAMGRVCPLGGSLSDWLERSSARAWGARWSPSQVWSSAHISNFGHCDEESVFGLSAFSQSRSDRWARRKVHFGKPLSAWRAAWQNGGCPHQYGRKRSRVIGAVC
jgi:MFS family permease